MCGPQSIKFSIIVCTRNPRESYFERVLAAIAAQSQDLIAEILVVDSGSQPPLTSRSFVWPPKARLLRVDQPGVSRARMAGVNQAAGNWVLFVDDDNVLGPDYLSRAVEIISRRPDVVLFCGRISGEFEIDPPEWLSHFHRQLAIIDFSEDAWANEWNVAKIPCWTAGMCVRADVIKEYCAEVQEDPFIIAVNRVEDVHMVMRTVAKGYTAGLFRALQLTHLISKDRMTPKYLCRIAHETGFNMYVIHCRDHGLSWRDFLRPVKNALTATIRHGLGPRGSIARAAAYGDLCGAVHCLLNPPPRGNSCA